MVNNQENEQSKEVSNQIRGSSEQSVSFSPSDVKSSAFHRIGYLTAEEVIKVNGATKKALFDKLPFGLANDLWFYIHLGNYGNTVCYFQSNSEYPLSFTLEFVRDGKTLFEVTFDGKQDAWDGLLSMLRSNARKILGVE